MQDRGRRDDRPDRIDFWSGVSPTKNDGRNSCRSSRSPRSLSCSIPDGVFSPERCATQTSRLYYTGWWVGLVKTVNLPEGKRRSLFAPFDWDVSSVLIEDTVIERAGFVSRRSESIKICRAGSSSRRFESLVVSMTTRRIPGLTFL